MKTDEIAALPLLDLSVLERLRTKADDGEWIWKVFVRNFVTGLPHTIERLRLALTTGDLTGALSAALSLKSSSQAAGAKRLAGLAVDLEKSLRDQVSLADPAGALPEMAASHLRKITRCAEQTVYPLRAVSADDRTTRFKERWSSIRM